MKQKLKKKIEVISFVISIIIWIFTAWIVFVTQSLGFLTYLFKENIITKNPVVFAGVLMFLSNIYIIWRVVIYAKK